MTKKSTKENETNLSPEVPHDNGLLLSKSKKHDAESLAISRIIKLKSNADIHENIFLYVAVDILNDLAFRCGTEKVDQFVLSSAFKGGVVNVPFDTPSGKYYIAYSKNLNEIFSEHFLKNIMDIIGTIFSLYVLESMMLSEIVSAEKLERERLARDLHDGTCQDLVSISLGLKKALFQQDNHDKEIGKILDQLDSTVYDIRRLSYNLKPSKLESGTLRSIIENLCTEMTRISNIKFHFEENIGDETFGSKDLVIYRVIQESINNIIKHSSASSAKITILKKGSDKLDITVYDNGIGFNLPDIKEGMGLQNMKNRVRQAGGEIEITTKINKGLNIYIRFDLSE